MRNRLHAMFTNPKSSKFAVVGTLAAVAAIPCLVFSAPVSGSLLLALAVVLLLVAFCASKNNERSIELGNSTFSFSQQ